MLPLLGIDKWEEESLSNLATKILAISPKPLILIDGKGGSGKSSLAKKLADVLNANLVCTDDIAWWLHPIEWEDELLNGIIKPWLNGGEVAYTPPGWIKKNREGFIEVDSEKPLIVEGSGVCRKTLREIANYTIWMNADPDLARERGIQRNIANGEDGGTLESVTEMWDWFDSIADPFLLEEEAWKHVDIIVSGVHSDLRTHIPAFS